MQTEEIGETEERGHAHADAAQRPLPPDQLRELAIVLGEVRHDRARSRPEILKRTGLGRAAVTQRVDRLVANGLLEAGAIGQSTGGRAPRTLQLRARAGRLLVADLGATSIHCAVTDVAGAVLADHEEPADITDGPEAILGRVEDVFAELEERVDDAPPALWGIGIGLPGPVEFDAGRAIAPPIMPGWDGYRVAERFSRRYGVPAWADNDVNVMALGELRAGMAVGREDVVFVKVGTGIGVGIIAGGQLQRGANGCAGDLGHMEFVEFSDIVCRCGKVGCLEAVAGGAALARDGQAAAESGRSGALAEVLREKGSIDALDVAVAANRGDPVSRDLIMRAGELLGRMLAIVVSMLNPSLIVIGGGVANAGDALLATVRGMVYRQSPSLAARDLTIERSALGDAAGVIGAANMVMDELFSPRHLGMTLDMARRSSEHVAG